MFRHILASLLFLIGSLGLLAQQDDISATLSRAEAFYYEARFRESIDLLLPLDSALRSEPGKQPEKINIKLQLALAHIGLSETAEAKTRFAELTQLDPDYSLDSQLFSEKVVTLFEEAKTEYNKVTCEKVCKEADRLLETGDAEALVAQIQSARNCGCLKATAMDAAEHFYQQGFDAYKRDDFTGALENFRTALKLYPEHELAASYIELTNGKLRLAVDRLFLEWRSNFDAHEFGLAAATYNRIRTADIEGSAAQVLDQMRIQYRQSLAPLVESWNQACAGGNAATLENLRRQAAELLPDPAIGDDLLQQMKTCRSKNCLEMNAQLAMARLKTRVDPEIPGSVRGGSVSVYVKARIDERGNVTVNETRGGDRLIRDAVKAAVERWTFLPAIAQNEPRCVQTEFSILVKR